MTASINPALTDALAALPGTLNDGGISFVAAMHTQRCQGCVQRVIIEVTKREIVYADLDDIRRRTV